MCLTKLTEKLRKNMKWYDISLIKGATFFFTLMLITVWGGFRNAVMSIDWYWFLVLAVACSIPIFKRMFFK